MQNPPSKFANSLKPSSASSPLSAAKLFGSAVGRFAPSPTGALHLGSLAAALGSFCLSRALGGSWILRVEDNDTSRNIAGAETAIVHCLRQHGLIWDGALTRQSDQRSTHIAYIDRLLERGDAYYCSCSRKDLQSTGSSVYPGRCRDKDLGPESAAVRLKVPDQVVDVKDLSGAYFAHNLLTQVGDFVLQRRDGIISYQLAAIVDDAKAGVNLVARGMDLLDNTPRQIHLQSRLGLAHPSYYHLPLVRAITGEKLSKQTGAKALNDAHALENLAAAWRYINPLKNASLLPQQKGIDFALNWAVCRWQEHLQSRLI